MTLNDKRFSARFREFLDKAPREGLVVKAAATADEPVELLMYDQIGEDMWSGSGVTAKAVQAALIQADGAPISVRINSPGGDVFEGFAIYNALVGYKGGVTTTVDGLAASAASWIALAGSKMTMNTASMFMIHNSATIAFGDKHDMTQTAGILAKLDGQFADIYAAKSGMSKDDVAAAMDAETYYTAAEAQAAGFADDVIAAPAAKTPPKKNEAAVPPVAEVIEPVAEVADPATERQKRIALHRLRVADSY